MAKKESLQHTLDRVRAPRVQITYDVEIGDSIEQKEIPFVVGVLGDFSGKPSEPLPKMKDRKFVEIDRDNFNKVLEGMKPRVAFRVDNKLANDGSQLAVDLSFKSMDDFHPENVAEQITPLKKLVEARKRLSDLLTKLDGNDKLDELLQDVISNTDSLKKLGDEAGVGAEDEGKKE
ncbi:MAG TPA: type VI secretion system contractile sheath small subunit [Deltaproteobacteria bacterium]|nr:type VI secretion system contractile sheath small subunit [Deltaproteobacteria bacterium]HPR54441.1 type VI secretion system contractile sheath small subunit [Deltaproteobacteria bacterium]HXK46230.1 type VI secretion system contractile sheath small subunit [Deltaproteobacteria bacterium]